MSKKIIDLGSGLGYTAPPEVTLPFNVSERTELAVDTYRSLGLVSDMGKARDVIGEQMQVLFDALVADNVYQAEAFKPIDFQEKFGLGTLGVACNKLYKERCPLSNISPWTDFFGEWDRYSADELNRRSFGAEGAESAASQARAMLLGGDQTEGLYFTNCDLEQQEAVVKDFMADYVQEHHSTRVSIINIADLLILNAQRMVEGRNLIDDPRSYSLGTVALTCFPQLGYESEEVHGIGSVVWEDSDHATYHKSYGTHVHRGPGIGIRLSVESTTEV